MNTTANIVERTETDRTLHKGMRLDEEWLGFKIIYTVSLWLVYQESKRKGGDRAPD